MRYTLALSLALAACQPLHAQKRVSAETLYQKNCAVCHGAEGRGDGLAAYLLFPRPRNFRRGAFRLISTNNAVPTQDDLVRTIKSGIPGTAMPSWEHLGEANQRELAAYIMQLRKDELVREGLRAGLNRAAAEKDAVERTTPGEVVQPATGPGTYVADDMKATFAKACAQCHAADGTGRNDPAWRTDEGDPIVSRNFVGGVFKGGRADIDLYRRIASGMPGTPMPAYGSLPPEYVWKMVRYIQSLSPASNQDRSWVRKATLSARRVPQAPADVGDPAWSSAPAVELALLPLWTTGNPGVVQYVTVRAAHDGKDIAFLLEWTDDHRDAGGTVGSFPDAAALQFSTDAEPPLFTMGEPGRAIPMWHWKAQWLEDRSAFALGPIVDRSAIDVYFGPKGWTGTRDEDPTYVTALAAGNSVARRDRGGHAEELLCAQFGTLTAVPADARSVVSNAEWQNGRWRLAMRHALDTPHPGDPEWKPGRALAVAFAVWNGGIRERNGQKSVSIWQNLRLDP